jgi:acetylornithine deacetylase/succinyl-diaminopimelate desuccinylase-like protein
MMNLDGMESRPESTMSAVEPMREEFESILRQLVEIPTVSSDPERREDLQRCAHLAADFLRRAGAQAEVFPTAGHPMVLGEFRVSASAPTVTVYNHLDVQPATPDEWTHPPFTFVKEGDRYLGRGTTDDKGPAVTALLAARRALDRGISLNIRFLWEMEEEIGSPNFESFLRTQKERLRTDSVVVSDTIWVARGRPAIDYGLRGLLGLVFRLRTGTKDVHSGLAGGAARNPFGELVDLLNRCHDGKTGRVKIPGFYDDVQRPTAAEMKGFLASGFSVPKFMAAHGLKSLRAKDAATVLRSVWGMPTFEIHGFGGGYSGPGVKTIVPPMAEAKVSLRLVPHQDPKKLLQNIRKFVKESNPDVEVLPQGFLEPYLGPSTGPYIEAATAAMTQAFGRKPVLVREGGSIGAVVSMNRALKAPILLMGLSLPEHSYHGPNEYFEWGQASGGIIAFTEYFERIASIASTRGR